MQEVPMSQISRVMNEQTSEFVRAVKIALFNGVIRDTRVDTGRLRGNWQTTTGTPAEGDIPRLDKEGTAAEADVVAGVKEDTIDFLTNNLPYAEVWEQRDGMVARNVARIDRIVRENVKR